MTHTKSENLRGKLRVPRVDKMSHRSPPYILGYTTDQPANPEERGNKERGNNLPCGAVNGRPRNPENEGTERPPYGGRTLSDPVASIANVATPACRFAASNGGKATLGRSP